MNRYIFAIFLFLVSTVIVFTQTKSFTREYTYNAGEADSELSSRTIARTRVKRILLEEIGVYLESIFSSTKEGKQVRGQVTLQDLTSSQITTIAAGITNTSILDEKWNGETFYTKVEIVVDVNDVSTKLKEVANNKQKVKALEDLRRRVDDASTELDDLRKEFPHETNENRRVRTQSSYNQKINVLIAEEWYAKGYNAFESKNFFVSMRLFTKAIDMNPQYAAAYGNRGNAKTD